MAYNFKNLADVELLSAMPEEANVLVEVNGTTKRAPNIDAEAKIVGSETLEEVPEGATVLAEVNGQIKRVPSAGLGGGKTLIVVLEDDFSVNMTFDEAVVAFAARELDYGYLYYVNDGVFKSERICCLAYDANSFTSPCFILEIWNGTLYWTADGFSIEPPESNNPPT